MNSNKIPDDNISGSSEIARQLADWLKGLSVSEPGFALSGLARSLESLEEKFWHFAE